MKEWARYVVIIAGMVVSAIALIYLTVGLVLNIVDNDLLYSAMFFVGLALFGGTVAYAIEVYG